MSRAREVVEQITTELFTVGRVEVVEELFRVDYVDNTPVGGFAGDRAGLQDLVRHLHATFDQVVVTAELVVAERGDWIAFRWRLRGLDPDRFLDDPVHGGEFDVHGNDILRLRGDRVAERWSEGGLGALLG